MPEKRKYRRLSESAWAEVRALWEVGDTSLEELSARFDISKRALQLHFARHDVKKGAKARELAAAVEKEVFGAEFTDKETLVERAKDIKECTYANVQVIENLIMAQLDLAQKDSSQAYKAASAMKMLSLAASALERTHHLKRTALGLDKDDPTVSEEMPVLIFRDLSKEDLEAIKAGHETEHVDFDVTEDPDREAASDLYDDLEEKEDEIVEVRPEDSETLGPTGERCRLVRGAR